VASGRRRRSPHVAGAVLAALAALAVACAGDAADEAQVSAALAASSPVTFPNDAGDVLAGRLFGPEDAGAGVVLVHGYSADQSAWYPFAARLGDAGYRVLTFDLRGYCPGGDAGCSEGEQAVTDAPADLLAAIDALRAEGVGRIALVGSSMGGTASLLVAADVDLEAVIALSAPSQFEGLSIGPDTLARIDEPKLFVAGTEDASAAETAQSLFDASLQPKRVEILTTADHGAEILRGNQGEQARNAIVGWLEVYLEAAAT
jgi:pimeloyl-ACP methyl ester carboxylesterase